MIYWPQMIQYSFMATSLKDGIEEQYFFSSTGFEMGLLLDNIYFDHISFSMISLIYIYLLSKTSTHAIISSTARLSNQILTCSLVIIDSKTIKLNWTKKNINYKVSNIVMEFYGLWKLKCKLKEMICRYNLGRLQKENKVWWMRDWTLQGKEILKVSFLVLKHPLMLHF